MANTHGSHRCEIAIATVHSKRFYDHRHYVRVELRHQQDQRIPRQHRWNACRQASQVLLHGRTRRQQNRGVFEADSRQHRDPRFRQAADPADSEPLWWLLMMPATTERIWSVQQEAIFDWFARTSNAGIRNSSQNLVVIARAGTGKTTTIIEGAKRAPEDKILICAFSKIIQEELALRIGSNYPNIEAKTLHAVGFACVRRYRDNLKVDFKGGRADSLTETVCEPLVPDAIKKLVSKLHTMGREIAPHAASVGDLTAIQITYECEPDEAWGNCRTCGNDRGEHGMINPQNAVPPTIDHPFNGFDAQYVEEKALDAMELAANVQSGETIDGSDMIFLPVRNGWLVKTWNLILVDEAQDMTTAQLEIAVGSLRPGGRICVVGDDRQAIFQFRGADTDSLARLQTELNASILHLNITYRCGQNIVNVAQRFVPDFTADENNPAGWVLDLHTDKLVEAAGPGDFILSRVNAPLVSTAMRLLRAGKRTRIAGRDIGTGLKSLIRRFKARTVPELLARLGAWESKEIHRVEAQMGSATNGRRNLLKAKIDGIRDQADMITNLVEGSTNVADIEGNIDTLFADDGQGPAGMITCSSVHRAKGLEAKRVFVLRDTLRDNNVEECNISYVAITRAKETLVWVSEHAFQDERVS